MTLRRQPAWAFELNRAATLLSWVEALKPLAEEELEELATRCQYIQMESGKKYGCNEEHEDGLLVVERGRVRVYIATPEGKQFTVTMLGDGATFPAWISPGLCIEAMEASTITFIRDEVLEYLIRKSPEVGLRLVGELSECLRQSNDRMFDMIHKDISARLASLILELIEDEGVVTQSGIKIPTHYTHEQLGSMIGANRVAVTKAFSNLQDLAVVELKRRLIHVSDADALTRLAGRKCIGDGDTESTPMRGSGF